MSRLPKRGGSATVRFRAKDTILSEQAGVAIYVHPGVKDWMFLDTIHAPTMNYANAQILRRQYSLLLIEAVI